MQTLPRMGTLSLLNFKVHVSSGKKVFGIRTDVFSDSHVAMPARSSGTRYSVIFYYL